MEIFKRLQKRIINQWKSLYLWVKIIIIIVGIIVGIFFVYLLKNLLFQFGDFIKIILGIPN